MLSLLIKHKPTIKLLALLFVLLLTACGQHTRHMVKPGETLYSIGWQYGHDYREVARWNRLDYPYIIHKGDWLLVAPPAKQENTPTARKQTVAKKSNTNGNNHKNTPVRKNNASPAASHAPQRKVPTSPPRKLAWGWPANGQIISKFNDKKSGIKGLNIAGRKGQAVLAAEKGKVVYSGNGLFGYGNLVIIKHNEVFLSAYAHNSKNTVIEGDLVDRGQKVAEMGNSGAQRTMLHFEIRKNGKPVNPQWYLPRK